MKPTHELGGTLTQHVDVPTHELGGTLTQNVGEAYTRVGRDIGFIHQNDELDVPDVAVTEVWRYHLT